MTAGRSTLAIGGPTATGKTLLAVELARRTGAELVNADSRQVVRRLVVGTARPTDAELRGVACHCLDLCEPGEPFSVADWMREARAALNSLDARGVPGIVVGGTGQYLRALREGWDFGAAAPTPEMRAELTALAGSSSGMATLLAELRERDPDGASALDVANPRRVVRAVELMRAAGRPLAASRGRSGGRALAMVVLDAERGIHHAALAARLDAMFDGEAIIGEARAELERGVTADALRRAGIGYAEALDVLAGTAGVDEAKAAAARRTNRYVKAQRTWFRQDPAILRLQRTATSDVAGLADAVAAAASMPGGSPR